jgi:hypothetical protein
MRMNASMKLSAPSYQVSAKNHDYMMTTISGLRGQAPFDEAMTAGV